MSRTRIWFESQSARVSLLARGSRGGNLDIQPEGPTVNLDGSGGRSPPPPQLLPPSYGGPLACSVVRLPLTDPATHSLFSAGDCARMSKAVATGGARIVTGPEPAVIDEELCRCANFPRTRDARTCASPRRRVLRFIFSGIIWLGSQHSCLPCFRSLDVEPASAHSVAHLFNCPRPCLDFPRALTSFLLPSLLFAAVHQPQEVHNHRKGTAGAER